MKTLHIYGQGSHHDPVRIVGSRDALQVLVTALNCVMMTGATIDVKNVFMVNDGEGFDLEIVCETDSDKMDALKEPYTDVV